MFEQVKQVKIRIYRPSLSEEGLKPADDTTIIPCEFVNSEDAEEGLYELADSNTVLEFFWTSFSSSFLNIKEADENFYIDNTWFPGYSAPDFKSKIKKRQDRNGSDFIDLWASKLEDDYNAVISKLKNELYQSDQIDFKAEFKSLISDLTDFKNNFFKHLFLAIAYLYSGKTDCAIDQFCKCMNFRKVDSPDYNYLKGLVHALQQHGGHKNFRVGVIISEDDPIFLPSAGIVSRSLQQLGDDYGFETCIICTKMLGTIQELKAIIGKKDLDYLTFIGHGSENRGFKLIFRNKTIGLSDTDLKNIFHLNAGALNGILLFSCHGQYYNSVGNHLTNSQFLIYDELGSDNQRAEIFSLGFLYGIAKGMDVYSAFLFGGMVLATRSSKYERLFITPQA